MHQNDPPITNTAAPTLKLPAELEPFLTLLASPTTLPICRSCQAALLPKSIPDHLRKHHQLPIELRGIVRTLVATLPALDFDDVPSNPEDSAPVEALRVVDVFQCNHCPFIRRDVTDVRKHINQEHSVSAAGGYEQVRAQSWFGGRRAVYWRVRAVPVAMEKKEKEEPAKEELVEEGPVAPNNTQSLCRWGLFGRGFGDKTPKSWREKERDLVYKVSF